MKKAIYLLLFGITFTACDRDIEEPISETTYLANRVQQGGATTIDVFTSDGFGTPASNLSGADLMRHLDGDLAFESVFVSAPADVNPGLGAIFNNSSCINCHPRDGRAPMVNNLLDRSGFFLRISIPGTMEDGSPVPAPGFGVQVQNHAVYGYQKEASFGVTWAYHTETLADGTQVELRKPTFTLEDTYIPLPANYMTSPRLAMPVFGLGLLEAMEESTILLHQDIDDADGDGISGKANYVWDPQSQSTVIGRFGWKANNPTLLVQNAGAYQQDMGVTNYVISAESSLGQGNYVASPYDHPDLPDEVLDDVTFYTQTLGVPALRNANDPKVNRGAKLFDQLDCAKCHVPRQVSGSHPVPQVANQVFYPYTDLLLHDMGEELADGRPDFLANGREWRTRPLWGIGLTQLINGHTDYLHDGRARNLMEAILWHGGEAENAKNQFKNLSTEDRNDLMTFLNSL